VAWLDDEPLVVGRVYWALHGHRWVKAKVKAIDHRIDIHTLAATPAQELPANAMGQVVLGLQQALPVTPFALSRPLGSLVLVDPASHRTAGAALVLA
jgi:sulfate adenylyltransferase subunit 1